MSAHGRHHHGRSQVLPSVAPELVVRTAEQPGYRARLPGLLEAVDEAHRLPVEVVLALHREQRVDPVRRLLARFEGPPNRPRGRHHRHHQDQDFGHPELSSRPRFKWVSLQRAEDLIWVERPFEEEAPDESQSAIFYFPFFILIIISCCNVKRRGERDAQGPNKEIISVNGRQNQPRRAVDDGMGITL